MGGRKRQLYKKIIHSREWHLLREGYIHAHPFCEECMKRGILDQPAEEVHHKTPIGAGRDLFSMMDLAFDRNNLEAVCHDCHVRIHKSMKTKKCRHSSGDSEVSGWLNEMFNL